MRAADGIKGLPSMHHISDFESHLSIGKQRLSCYHINFKRIVNMTV